MSPEDTLSQLLEREEGGERERERENIDWLPPIRAQPGIEPAAQVRALTGNRTHNLLRCTGTSNQLSHTGQGRRNIFNIKPNIIISQQKQGRRVFVFLNVQTLETQFLCKTNWKASVLSNDSPNNSEGRNTLKK